MADVLLDNSATGAADGTTWTDAYTTWGAAIAGLSASDRLIVADSHTESGTASVTWSFPNNVTVISSTVSGSTTVTYSKATGNQWASTTSNDDVSVNAVGSYWHGVQISAGRTILSNNVTWDDCVIYCNNGGTSGSIRASSDQTASFLNCTIGNLSSTASSHIFLSGGPSCIYMENCTVTSARTTTSSSHYPFRINNNVVGFVIVINCDFSGVVASALFSPFSNNYKSIFIASGCLLNSNMTSLSTNTLSSNFAIANTMISACDTANTINREYQLNKFGQYFSETSIYLDATDGLNSYSRRIATNSASDDFFNPSRFKLANGWADFSTSKTLTVELCQDGTTTGLDDAQCWVEVVFPDDTTSLRIVETTKASDNQTTSTLTSSSASWTGLSGTNVKQKIALTTSATGKEGSYEVFISVAKASTTVYVDPLITVT
jgi:hypothetical protein